MVTLLLSFDLSSGSTAIVIPSKHQHCLDFIWQYKSVGYIFLVFINYLASKNIMIETPR